MNCCAISSAKRNPAQAAETSRQAAFVAPIFVCTKQAVGGKYHVGRGRGDEDEIDVVARDAGLLHGGKRGLGGHVAGVFIVRGDAALLDAGARRDPLVGQCRPFAERSSFVRTLSGT